MNIQDLLENDGCEHLKFFESEKAKKYELHASVDIKLPTGRDYSIIWLYNGNGAIHERKNYEIIEYIEKNGSEYEKKVPVSIFMQHFKECGNENDILDRILEYILKRYDQKSNLIKGKF